MDSSNGSVNHKTIHAGLQLFGRWDRGPVCTYSVCLAGKLKQIVNV